MGKGGGWDDALCCWCGREIDLHGVLGWLVGWVVSWGKR